jgi:NAD kinase
MKEKDNLIQNILEKFELAEKLISVKDAVITKIKVIEETLCIDEDHINEKANEVSNALIPEINEEEIETFKCDECQFKSYMVSCKSFCNFFLLAI